MFSLSRNSLVVWFGFVIASLLFREFANLSDVYRTETCRFLFSGHGRRERVRSPARIPLFLQRRVIVSATKRGSHTDESCYKCHRRAFCASHTRPTSQHVLTNCGVKRGLLVQIEKYRRRTSPVAILSLFCVRVRIVCCEYSVRRPTRTTTAVLEGCARAMYGVVSPRIQHTSDNFPNQLLYLPHKAFLLSKRSEHHLPSGNTRRSTTLVAHNCQFEHRFGRCMCGDFAVADFARPRTQFVCVCFLSLIGPRHTHESQIPTSHVLDIVHRSVRFQVAFACLRCDFCDVFRNSAIICWSIKVGKNTTRCGRRLSVLQVSFVVHHNHAFRISTAGCGSCGKERCVSCAKTEVMVNTITTFNTWMPLVLPLCDAVRRALGRLQFFLQLACFVGQSGLWHSECRTNM